MGDAERDRHPCEQGRDAERDLKQDDHRDDIDRQTGPPRQPGASRRKPEPEHRKRRGHRQDPMVELHRRRILEEVPEQRVEEERTLGHQPTVHQGKGVVHQPGIQPGNEGAGECGHGDEREEWPGVTAQTPKVAVVGGRGSGQKQAQRDPQDVGVDGEGEPQVGRQPILADAGIVDQAALHHVPAERALQPAEEENGGEVWPEGARDTPFRKEIEEG